ncbi:flagellar biosynthesis repressor FlbT [Rhodopseudomonas boonkerdii]|nr:flagellar biosynthesis repressor FlbT [Rhodopseudomonas boonkerdii]
MKKPMCISLRSGEKIYINGAVLRVDRKVTLELINDVTFLLESQVMQVDDATTPMRQLYFVVQLMLMSPGDIDQAKAVFGHQRCALYAAADNAELLGGLDAVETLVEAGRYYEALRKIRSLFDIEQSILTSAEMLLPVAVA